MDARGVELGLGAMVQFSYVWAVQLLERADVRVLAIKGPVHGNQGIRAPKISSDVDLWVAPTDVAAAVDALTARGWAIDERRAPSILPPHATSLRHPSWPVEIDLHHRYPGMSVSPQAAFDLMWAARESVDILHVDVPCPPPAVGAIIEAIHAIKDGRVEQASDPHRNHLTDALAARLLTPARPAGPDDIFRWAVDLGAVHALRGLWAGVGVSDADVRDAVRLEDPAAVRDFELQVGFGRMKGMPALVTFARAPLRSKIRILCDAAFLTENEMAEVEGATTLTRRELWRGRLRRVVGGLMDLPSTIVAYARFSLTHRQRGVRDGA